MHEKYIKGLHPVSTSFPCPTVSWRHLEEMQHLAEQNIRWSLGEGLVNFWRDRWLFDEPLCSILDRSESPHFLVAEFVSGEAWNKHCLLQWVPVHVVRAIQDVFFFNLIGLIERYGFRHKLVFFW